MSEETAIRKHTDDDIPFIKSTWLAHQSYNEPYKHMNEFEFKSAYSKTLDFILPHLDIAIICNKEHPDQIYGYIAYFNDILNFIYVKGIYRNMGFSKVLISFAFNGKQIKYYTHLSDNKHFKAMVSDKNIKYNKFKFN